MRLGTHDTHYPSWGTFTIRPADLAVDSNNDGTIDAADAEVEDEGSGVIIPVNDDDDDNDGTPDMDQSGTVAGEDDLAELKLSLFPPDASGTVSLTVAEGYDKVRLYETADRSTPLTQTTWPAGQQPSSVWAEAIAPSLAAGDLHACLAFQASGATPSGSDTAANTNIANIDLDVDTANDDGYGTVFDNAAEDRDEARANKGKYVPANTGDLDDDGVLDFADLGGIAGGKFVPVFLRLPASFALAGATPADVTLTFTYSFSDPTGVTTTPAPNHLRLWTVDASGARGEGELIRSGEQLTAADLNLNFGGTKTLYVEAVRGSTTNRPITVGANVTGTIWSGSVIDTVHVTPVGFKLQSVDFSESNPANIFDITSDDGATLYDEMHWRDENTDGVPERQWPVAYRRGAAMLTERRFVVDAPSSFVLDSAMAIAGDGPYSYDFYSRYNHVDPNDSHFYFERFANIIITADTAAQPFPEWIDHFDPMKIKWAFSIDGGTNWVSIRDTKNQVYTTLDTPTSSTLYHTLIHLSSKNAKGLNTAAAAIPAVWGEFADRSVTRVDGVTMVYDPAQLGHTALTPLSRGDGHGQCSSWADLLAQMFGTQGINAQQRLIAPGAGYDEFQVADGPVQGGVVLTAPNTQFTFHVVVELSAVPDRIYDASFGVITNKTTAGSVELQWEADHVVDFRDVGSPPFIPPFWIHANPVGQQLDWSNWP